MNANGAWLVLAAMAFNLTCAAGTLASKLHGKATTATIRAQLITVPARIAYSARRLRLHLPERWPWEDYWHALFAATGGPPISATGPPIPVGPPKDPRGSPAQPGITFPPSTTLTRLNP